MNSTQPKPFVFVLMPFDEDFSDIYELGIKPACAEAGAYAERLDEQLFKESMLQRIYNQIAKADIIVSDMTGRNANVFYETGYAHALGKHVILLTQNTDDIPFDLKHYPHLVYQGAIRELKPQLIKRVSWAIQNMSKEGSYYFPELRFFLGGSALSNNPIIDYPLKADRTSVFRIKIDAHNPSERQIRTQDFRAAFVTSEKFIHSKNRKGSSINTVKLPDGNRIHLPDEMLSLLPGDWQSIYIELIARESPIIQEDIESIILRIFTYSGTLDFPFLLRAIKKQ